MVRVPADDEVSLASFLKVLGTGSSGTVWLVTTQDEESEEAYEEWFALKVSPAAATARSEQSLLATLHHPYIIQFHGATCDPFKSFMLIEACFFGDLASLLRCGQTDGRRNVLSEGRARDIAVRVVSALEYMHGRGIVYRDLKPENIILDDRGLIKLVDMGLAKATTDACYTLCGTAEYLAPEVVQLQGHRAEVDWWALGVCVYEMLHGHTPFSSEPTAAADAADATGACDAPHVEREVFRRITHPDFKPEYASALSKPVISCMKRLLRRAPSKRLGAQGGPEVRAHGWFDGVDWHGLLSPVADVAPHTRAPPQRVLASRETSPQATRRALQRQPSLIPELWCEGSGYSCEGSLTGSRRSSGQAAEQQPLLSSRSAAMVNLQDLALGDSTPSEGVVQPSAAVAPPPRSSPLVGRRLGGAAEVGGNDDSVSPRRDAWATGEPCAGWPPGTTSADDKVCCADDTIVCGVELRKLDGCILQEGGGDAWNAWPLRAPAKALAPLDGAHGTPAVDAEQLPPQPRQQPPPLGRPGSRDEVSATELFCMV